MEMSYLELWELASYIVTVVALPFGIYVFILEQKKERQNEDEEIYQHLSDEYADFSRLLIENADLRLMSAESNTSYILVYEDDMDKQTQRLWASWEDYIHYWCAKKDFRDALPELLTGEDPDFGIYIRAVASTKV
jgi:hypothetical protein